MRRIACCHGPEAGRFSKCFSPPANCDWVRPRWQECRSTTLWNFRSGTLSCSSSEYLLFKRSALIKRSDQLADFTRYECQHALKAAALAFIENRRRIDGAIDDKRLFLSIFESDFTPPAKKEKGEKEKKKGEKEKKETSSRSWAFFEWEILELVSLKRFSWLANCDWVRSRWPVERFRSVSFASLIQRSELRHSDRQTDSFTRVPAWKTWTLWINLTRWTSGRSRPRCSPWFWLCFCIDKGDAALKKKIS